MDSAGFRRILGLCATGIVRDEHASLRAQALAALTDFESFVDEAEDNGIAPLVALHLGNHAEVPVEVRRALSALVARHTLAHRARTQALMDAVVALDEAGIDHLFLKGAALAHLAYAKPELRPMRDVDLLLRDRELARAEQALERAGFVERIESRPGLHEVATRFRRIGPFAIGLDLHRRLGLLTLPRYGRGAKQTLDELWADSQPFFIGQVKARAPGHEDLLRLVFRHGFALQLDEDRLRFVAVADCVTAMERWVDTMDWQRLRALDAEVFEGLAMLHHVVPLSERVLGGLQYHPRIRPLSVGNQYWGWPRVRRPRAGNAWHWLMATLFPSEWWLRTRHGGRSEVIGLASSWGRHLTELALCQARRRRGLPRIDR